MLSYNDCRLFEGQTQKYIVRKINVCGILYRNHEISKNIVSKISVVKVVVLL